MGRGFLLLFMVVVQAESSKYSKISSQMSLSRKLFRLAFCLEEFSKLSKVLEFPNGLGLESILSVLRHLSGTIYWTLDNVYWLQKTDLHQVADMKKVNHYRVLFWLINVLLSVEPTIKAYLAARATVKSDDKKTQQNLTIQQCNVLRVAGDVIVSVSYSIQSDVIPALFEPHEGVMGLAGVVSGLAGLYSAWETIKY